MYRLYAPDIELVDIIVVELDDEENSDKSSVLSDIVNENKNHIQHWDSKLSSFWDSPSKSKNLNRRRSSCEVKFLAVG